MELRHKRSGGDKSTKDMTQEELLLYSINYFHDSLEKRAEMGATTSRLMNRVIRIGIFGMFLIAVSILVLVVIVSKQMTDIAAVTLEMDQRMESIVSDMGRMDEHVARINTSTNTLPLIISEMSQMSSTVQGMDDHTDVMSHTLDNSLPIMNSLVVNMEQITHSMNSVGGTVQRMDQSVGKVSRPFKWMSKMMP